MMHHTMLTVVLCLLPVNAFAQEVGSAEAYKYLKGLSDRQEKQQGHEFRMKMLWDEAKKLYKVKPQVMQMSTEVPIGPKFKIGDTGCVDRFETTVRQVVDDSNAVLQVGDSTLWLQDFNTSDLVDNQKVRLIGFVKIEGTKSYETVAGGSKTVFYIKFLSEDESRQLQKKLDEINRRVAQAAEDAKYKKWTTERGKEIEGKVIEIKKGVVTFQTKDGAKTRLYLSIFPASQQKLIEGSVGK